MGSGDIQIPELAVQSSPRRAETDVSSYSGTFVAGDANRHRIVTTFDY